jgi:hypothetical protein
MIVNLWSLEDFIAEITAERDSIADNIVRWMANQAPLQKEGISHQVEVWATAVRADGQGEPWLLEFGQVAGEVAADDSRGMVKAEELRFTLKTACDKLGLKLRPGKIELV